MGRGRGARIVRLCVYQAPRRVSPVLPVCAILLRGTDILERMCERSPSSSPSWYRSRGIHTRMTKPHRNKPQLRLLVTQDAWCLVCDRSLSSTSRSTAMASQAPRVGGERGGVHLLRRELAARQRLHPGQLQDGRRSNRRNLQGAGIYKASFAPAPPCPLF